MLARTDKVRTSEPIERALAWTSAAAQLRPGRRADMIGSHFRPVIEHAPFGVLVFSESGTVIIANRRASAIFGYGSRELVGQPLERLLPDSPQWSSADLTKGPRMNPQALKMGQVRALTGIRSDGAFVPLEVGLSVASVYGSDCVIASVVDLTERLKLEARVSAGEEDAGYQRLVADVASVCAEVDPSAVDDAVSRSLHRVAEALQLDGAWVWRVPAADLPGTMSRSGGGRAAWFTKVDDCPDPVGRETFRRARIASGAVFPLPLNESQDGLLTLVFNSLTHQREWSPSTLERLRLVAAIIDQTLARKASHLALQAALQQLTELRDRLTAENVELRREARSFRSSRLIVAESAAMRRALGEAEQVGPTPATVLLLGETGVGKDVFAQALHDLSPRHRRPMIRVSCAAIPTALMESELFGRERGAYTGAVTRQIGRFEAANQSTLFLDEIGDLPAEMQVKLLRVLQERVVERLGSNQAIKVDVRIIAATNRNLEKAVEDKSFREDLFYRLNVFPIVVPPLRDRTEDIPGLVWAFIDEFSRDFGKTISSVSKETIRELQRHTWPGNVRELRNVVERAVILANGPHLTVPVPKPATRVPQAALTLAGLEAEHIRAVLESTNWRVRGSGGAAQRLGLKPTTLESRMERLGINRPTTGLWEA